MNSNDSGINLFDQQPEPKRNRKTALALTGLVALGLAGAIGLGFVIGGRGGSSAGASAGATSTATVSADATQYVAGAAQPTRAPHTHGANTTPAATPTQIGGYATGGSASAEGSVSNAGDPSAPVSTNTAAAPAATNTSVAAASTSTPIPPTNTPVAPTSTSVPPTSTATSTPIATATAGVCVVCLDPVIHVCVPCLIIDVTPPSFSSTYVANCPGGTYVEFHTSESAELWVTYTFLGIPNETLHVHGTSFSTTIGGVIFYASDIVFHATDDAGNAATFAPTTDICI